MKTVLLLPLLLSLSVSYTESANILFLTPMGSPSHKIFFMGIVNALAERGHKVTILSAFKDSTETKNVIDVAIPELDVMSILSEVFKEKGSGNMIKDLVIRSPQLCNDGLALKGVQDIKKQKYDLIVMSVFFNYCYLSLVHHFKVPLILASPSALEAPFASMSGSINFPSIVPHKLLDAAFPLSFTQRFLSIILNSLFAVVFPFYIIPKSEEICLQQGLCPPDMPRFQEFFANSSLFFVNSIRALENPPRPVMPHIIYAGGAHLKPGKPLPKELDSWIEGAGEAGFIFFSLGSALKPSDIPESSRKILVKVFGSLPQRVLWKWDEESMPDLPPNVKLSKWLPQQDVLANKKLRLFITHGGLMGTMEATYNNIPCLGMPVFADQFSNMKEAANEGWARVLSWKDLTEESFRTIITEIISNKSLRVMSAKRAALMKDVPIQPANEATFWMEFVLRHGGAEHLKSPLFKISWYELYNLDVWAAVLIIIFLIIYLNYITMKALLMCCCGKKQANTKSKAKKKKE